MIGWIIRILAVLLAIRLILRLVAGIVRGLSPSAEPGKVRQPATREGGHLVRDPHCGTYVPVARALRDGSGDRAVYFCSDECRRAWAGRKG